MSEQGASSELPGVSVVIPSYNEGEDLIVCLDHALNQSVPFKELIVVDDSSDGTDRLVEEKFGNRVELIHRQAPMGRCSARNAGIRHSSAQVVVILNADVYLPHDFCERIARHYAEGDCDALSVDCLITNLEHSWSRYMYSNHKSYKPEQIGWTEGFSVRRENFLRTKGFPDGFALPLLAGEDVAFVEDLISSGAKFRQDFSIVVETTMPVCFKEICSQISGRASLRTHHFVKGYSLLLLLFLCMGRTLKHLLSIGLVFPVAWKAWVKSGKSPEKERDFLPFLGYEFLGGWLAVRMAWKEWWKLLKVHLHSGVPFYQALCGHPAHNGPGGKK